MEKFKNNDFIELLESSKRGKLKVYIGSIAGVGKTYRMLSEAHILKNKNIDIVIGFVETHGRPETEKLLKGLEIIPCEKVDYNGVVLNEMDLDTIIARRPEVVIVDELAHTNSPLSRNQKRYQDVVELLLAGINVICAFNIQHLESLNDIVLNATGIQVSETIPDSFFEYADQIVNIDLSVEDLLDRLKSGHIYKKDKIDQALKNFFKPENISQLRELALREVAESVEIKKVYNNEVDHKNWSTSDRLMLIYQPAAHSQKYLIRKASRLVGKLNTDWFITFVETKSNTIDSFDADTKMHFYEDIQFAQDLGAQFKHLHYNNFIDGQINFANSENIKHIMLANQKVKWYERYMFTKEIIDITRFDKFDIYLISNVNIDED